MKNVFRIILVLTIIGLFAWTLVYLYGKSQKPPEEFETESPFVATVIKKAVATGSVVPRKEVLIKPKISGIIDKIYVVPGQKVNKGDLIARVTVIPDMVNLNNAETRLNKSRIELENSKANMERNKTLFASGAISKSEMQVYETAYRNAKEETEAAENNLSLIKEGASKKAGSVSNTLIKSTIAGMILDIPVEEGNSVIESNTFNDGTTIAIIADMSEMIFLGKVDESEVGKLKTGMDLILIIGAIENETFEAKLEYIAPKGVEENGAIQFEIKAALVLKENVFIRAGYSGNADIVLARADSTLVIHESLLQFEKQKPFVEVETTTQIFEKKYIETGLSDGINIQVLSGIDKDAKIKQWNTGAKTDKKTEE